MSDTERSGNVSRRRLLQAGGVASLSLAALGAERSTASATPVDHTDPQDLVFDPAKPGRELFSNKYLSQVRTVPQSFVIDTMADHVYVLQIVQANTSLPGDEPGDESYASRVARGDLALTKLDLSGNRLGVMYLKFFGHGVSMGIEYDGRETWLWTEIDSVPNSGGQARGSHLTRFQFFDGKVLDAEHDDSLYRRELIPGSTQNTCNIDPVNDKMVVRYWRNDEFRYALYNLDDVKAEKSSYTPIYDIATPPAVSANLFQGYASLGEHLYTIGGTAYGASNPEPPEGKGNAHLTRVSWGTGKVEVDHLETTALDHHRREPEGLSVAINQRGHGSQTAQLRLYSGFGTSAHESKDADRLSTIYYRDVARH